MKTNERLFRVFQTREDWLLHSESLFIFFIFNVVILSFAGRRSRTYGPVRYLPSFTVHLLKLTGVIISFKILAKKKFKYCNEFGKARFDSSQDSSLFILAANHNLWRMWNYFYRYWHEIAISRKLLLFHRVHSKVHAKIVLMSVKFGNNFTLFYHCRAKTYQIDVLIYLSRRKTGPSLNSAILLLIEFPIHSKWFELLNFPLFYINSNLNACNCLSLFRFSQVSDKAKF